MDQVRGHAARDHPCKYGIKFLNYKEKHPTPSPRRVSFSAEASQFDARLSILQSEKDHGASVPIRESSLFTPTEAAVLTGLSVKAVHNAIDKRTIPNIAGRREGHATRQLDLHGLMSLTLERRLADRLVPELRRPVFDVLNGASRRTVSLDGGFLRIDLREPRRELATSLRELRRARQLVISDPDIMGGEPVFRGTGIPVHVIASLLGQGSAVADLLEGYPRLTAEMARLAPTYAAAYPLGGRPRAQLWRDRPPTHANRRKLSIDAV